MFIVESPMVAGVAKVTVAAGASVAALVEAAAAALRIDARPGAIFLSLSGTSAPPLDATLSIEEALASGALVPRANLVATVRDTAFDAARCALIEAQPLPLPLVFAREDVAGEPTMVAGLGPVGLGDPAARPLFLAPGDFAELARFVAERPSREPQMLLFTGTAKSGKTCALRDVIPGLLAAQHTPGALHPVIAYCRFDRGVKSVKAARRFAVTLSHVALDMKMSLPPVTDDFPHVAAELAKRVRDAGGVLWLLLDDLQAPVVASSHAEAMVFMQSIKTTVEICSPHARIAGAGSGLAFLTAVRKSPADGASFFARAFTYISLGREPRPAVALAMAERIVGAYASRWPADATFPVTPERAVAMLARSAHAGLTSPRPALVDFLVCYADSGRRSNEDLYAALNTALIELRLMTAQDALTALERMRPPERRALRALAATGAVGSSTSPDRFAAGVAEQLCEADGRLLPPYGPILMNAVSADGALAVGAGRSASELMAFERYELCFGADWDAPLRERVRKSDW